MSFFDFNSAAEQSSYDLIPKNTVACMRLSIKPGGYDDPSQGWTGGYATRSTTTGSVYLNCEFVVMEGPFARRKMWSLIGLHSPKGAEWGNMGRTFIKAILNSARGIHPGDNSPSAQNARRISGFVDLEGLEFVGKVDWEKDQNGQDKCVIKSAVTPDHKEYAAHMSGAAPAVPQASAGGQGVNAQANAYAQASGRAPVSGRPSWAQ